MSSKEAFWFPGVFGFLQEKDVGTVSASHEAGGPPGSASPAFPALQTLAMPSLSGDV